MADKRLEEAQLLYENKYYDAAYYLSGYAIEFALKAVICRRLNVEIFDSSQVSKRIASPFQIHELPILVVFSGLQVELSNKKNLDADFDAAWSLVSQWNEIRRYEEGCSQKTAKEFSIGTNTLLSWIKTYW